MMDENATSVGSSDQPSYTSDEVNRAQQNTLNAQINFMSNQLVALQIELERATRENASLKEQLRTAAVEAVKDVSDGSES